MSASRCRVCPGERASHNPCSSSRVTRRLSPTLLEAELAIGFQLFTCVCARTAWRIRRCSSDAERAACRAPRERYLSQARAYAHAATPPSRRAADRLRRAVDR